VGYFHHVPRSFKGDYEIRLNVFPVKIEKPSLLKVVETLNIAV
jgi:hypothetical protein